MEKDRKGVEVGSQVFWGSFPGCDSPIFSAAERDVWYGELRLGPLLDSEPELLREAAVNEEVGAALFLDRAERTESIVRPSFMGQIIRSLTAPMDSQPHEKFVFHRSFGLSDGLDANKIGVGGEEVTVSGACMPTNQLYSVLTTNPPTIDPLFFLICYMQLLSPTRSII